MAPPKLPEVNADPAILEGQAIGTQYVLDAGTARADFSATDIDRARRVVAVWNAANTRRAQLYQDLQKRREARADWIETQLPIGPGISDDASPADRTVLQQAFNAALGKARNSTSAERRKLLADGARFGDDAQIRGTFTACFDDSATDVIDEWLATSAPETGALLEEWRILVNQLAGQGFDNLWVNQALSQIPKPQEVFDLPGMVNAYNVAALAYNRSARGPGMAARPLMEL